MKSERTAPVCILLLLLVAILSEKPLHAEKPVEATAPDDLLLATMEKELHRGQSELAKQDPAPYFASYNVTDGESLVILSAQGGILTSTRTRHRAADVSMRIGLRSILREWAKWRGRSLDIAMLAFSALLLVLGVRAALAVYIA